MGISNVGVRACPPRVLNLMLAGILNTNTFEKLLLAVIPTFWMLNGLENLENHLWDDVWRVFYSLGQEFSELLQAKSPNGLPRKWKGLL